jgi:hypothetical protein
MRVIYVGDFDSVRHKPRNAVSPLDKVSLAGIDKVPNGISKDGGLPLLIMGWGNEAD